MIAGRATDYVIEPVHIDLPLLYPQTTKLTHVSCGRAHTVIVTDSEGGNNLYIIAFFYVYSVSMDFANYMDYSTKMIEWTFNDFNIKNTCFTYLTGQHSQGKTNIFQMVLDRTTVQTYVRNQFYIFSEFWYDSVGIRKCNSLVMCRNENCFIDLRCQFSA